MIQLYFVIILHKLPTFKTLALSSLVVMMLAITFTLLIVTSIKINGKQFLIETNKGWKLGEVNVFLNFVSEVGQSQCQANLKCVTNNIPNI